MRSHKKETKRFRMAFILVLTLLLAMFTANASADAAKNPLAIDMVIVIENSTRMNDANTTLRKLDANGLRFDAASALIGMCDAKYSRATFFLFNEDLYVYNETETGNVQKVKPEDISLFDISIPVQKTQRQNLMNILNGTKIKNGYGTKQGTDIGKAISAAVDVEMREANNGNRKVILLLTAGNNQLSSASIAKAQEAKKLADENNIEIYSVAVKDNSSATLLKELASKPGNYQFAATPEDLVDVFRNFFADMIGSNPLESKPIKLEDGSSQITLEVPNNSVAEVNIIIPKMQIANLTLSDESGKQISKTSDDVLVNESRNFVSYKLISPKAENYTLRYTTEDEQNIVVQYVFSYGVQVDAMVNAAVINKNDPVTLTAKYVENGIPTSDSKLYKIPATLSLWKGERMIEEHQMEAGDNQYQFTFPSLESYGVGAYRVTIHFEGDGLYRDSEPVEFELINNAPELVDTGRTGANYAVTINQPKNPDSYDVTKNGMQWNLNEYVKDINNDPLKPEIISNTLDADVSISNDLILSIVPKKDKATSGEVHVVLHDPDGGTSPELIFSATIENYEDRYDAYMARFDAVKGLEKNSTCDVTLRIFDGNGNEVRGDNQLPETVEATVTPSVSKAFNIILNYQNGAWVGEFPTGNESEEYILSAVIHIGQKTVKADNATISSSNKAPVLKAGAKDVNSWEITINDPSDPESYKKKDKTWALTDLVVDPNGDAVEFEVDKQLSISDVETTINKADKTLTITSKTNQEADGEVIVHSKDNEGVAGPDLTFHVVIQSKEEIYKKYTAQLDADGKGKSRDTTISLSVFDENKLLVTGDSNLPNELDASITLNDETTPLNMVRGEDGKWTGTFRTLNQEVTYAISASVKVSDNVSIVAPELTLSTVNTAPSVTKQINASGLIPETINVDPFLIWNQETGEIVIEDLNEYFNDKDLDKLKFTITDSTLGDSAEAVIKENRLTINGKAETSEPVSFTITATDNEGLAEKSAPIEFSVKSLKKQGLIIIALAVAALIALFILYQIFKPGFKSQLFEVSTQADGQPEMTQGTSISMKGKKALKLGSFSTAGAKQFCGSDISVATLNNIALKPAYSNRVKVKLSNAVSAEVSIGTDKLSAKKGGTLSPNGTLIVKNNGRSIRFRLKKAGPSAAIPSTAKPGKPTMPSSGTGTATAPKRSGRT